MSQRQDKIEYELALRSPQTGGFDFVIRWQWSFATDSGRILHANAKCYRCESADDVDYADVPTAPFHYEKVRILSDSRPAELNEFDSATPVLDLSVKWDGCTNTNFAQYLHLCELDYMVQFADLIKYVTNKAAKAFEESGGVDAEITEGGLTYLPPIPYQPQGT